MQGVPLASTIEDDTPVREAALFGVNGGHVNATDGRYVYMRAPACSENKRLMLANDAPPEQFERLGLVEAYQQALQPDMQAPLRSADQ